MKNKTTKPIANADEAKEMLSQAKDITHVVGLPSESEFVKPDSEKKLLMKVNVDHNGKVYAAGTLVPEEFAELFTSKEFAELV